MKISDLTAWLSNKDKINISCPKEATEEICSHFIKNRIIVFDKGIPYIKCEDFFRCIIEEDILMIINNLVVDHDRIKLKSAVPKEVYKRLKYDMRFQVDISDGFYKSQKYLNLNNGIFNISTGRLEIDRKDMLFDYKLDFSYYPNSSIDQTTAFKNYIRTSIGEDSLECLLRSTAYCISSLTQGRVAVVLQGKGQTGKSVWLMLLEHIIDQSLRSNVSFQDMAKQEYLIKLMGKRINICTDVDNTPIKNEGIFKRITASEQVTARDLFQSAVDFRPTLKLIACTNSDLSFKHPDDEVYDRLVIIPFTRTVEKKDPQLINKLIAEKDIIFSLACDSLSRLVNENYDFKMSEKGKEYIQKKRDALHPEQNFAEQRLIVDAKGELSSQILWDTFKQWCSDNVVEHMGQNHFLKYIEDIDPTVHKTTIGPSYKRINGFKGIRFKTDADYANEGKE